MLASIIILTFTIFTLFISPRVIMRFRQLLPLFGALFALYIIWGSTYFVIRIGVESWPPLMMAGVRFLSAGMLLMAFLLLRGEKLPPLRQTINAALIGLLLLAVGNGLVTVAEHQNVPSGIAAVVVATVRYLRCALATFLVLKRAN
ncbi:inner membrane transporter yedA [Salmonella enterica subsp. enterica]|uniref:Inner membrane transporter yedA n=1 Tax=Salmonella enterica I TaxID=59201 RepID=A0A379WRA4_SALET|nr:inner membrane transporter yedA [Salmonella enterica subsp. enterica]